RTSISSSTPAVPVRRRRRRASTRCTCVSSRRSCRPRSRPTRASGNLRSRSGLDRRGGPVSIEVKVPQLPESVTDATLVSWHKKPGEPVRRDENLVDLETDKVVLEVPAPSDGVLKEIRVQDGTTVTSGQVLAVLDPDGAAQAAAEPAPAAEPSRERDAAAEAAADEAAREAVREKTPAERRAEAEAPRGAEAAAPRDAAQRMGPAVRKLVE